MNIKYEGKLTIIIPKIKQAQYKISILYQKMSINI